MRIKAEPLTRVLGLIENRVLKHRRYRESFVTELEEVGRGAPSTVLREIAKAFKALLTPLRTENGLFIVLTGIDRSGKDTQGFNPKRIPGVTSVRDYLTNLNYRVKGLSLPSYKTVLGSLVMSYLQDGRGNIRIIGQVPADKAWILWSLDRAQHNPCISQQRGVEEMHAVVSKRWTESSVAYQKPLDGALDKILALDRNLIKPDYILVMDITVEEVFNRIRETEEWGFLYGREDYLRGVRETYLNLGKYYPFGRIFVVKGTGYVRRVNEKMLQILRSIRLERSS